MGSDAASAAADGGSTFLYSFLGLSVVLLGILFSEKDAPWRKGEGTEAFRSFQRNYLLVYILAFLGDWLQGPYVYALYEHYGFSESQIGVLFIFGFGSSLVFGTFIGALADKYGRKRCCLLYCILYIASCLSKHSSDFFVLLFGRVTGGIATSLLWSSFESWMVYKHKELNFPPEWQGSTFGLAVLTNGICAIAAGVVGNVAKEATGSYVAPFDVAAIALAACFIIVLKTWTENYGDQSADVMGLALVQSLFEGAMYIFVFLWTPSLGKQLSSIPHGLIFAAFMVCVMIGGAIFNKMASGDVKKLSSQALLLFIVATVALSVPVLTQNWSINYVFFCIFEGCVGVFWPVIGTLRSAIIPEEVRASVMNYFRIILNVIVVAVLINIDRIPIEGVFALSALGVAVGFVMLFSLSKRLPAMEFKTDGSEQSAVNRTTEPKGTIAVDDDQQEK